MGKLVLEEFFNNVQRHPKKICLADEKCALTFEEVWRILSRGRRYLKSKGLGSQDRLCLVGEQSIVFLLLVSSAHFLGVTVVPMEKGISPTRVNEILDLMDTKWVAGRKENLPAGSNVVDYQEFENVCITDDSVFCLTPCFDNLFVGYPQDILFTTGTTGSPKGIMLSAKAVCAVAENIIASVGMKKDEVELIICPLFHSMGIRRYYSGLVNGSTVVINSGSPFLEDVPRLMNIYGVTSVVMVPSLAAILFRFHENELRNHADTLRYIQVGSTFLADNTVKKIKDTLPQTAIYNIYGLSEAGCTNSKNLNDGNSNVLCVGRITPKSKVLFDVNGDIREKASKDTPGTILLGGDILMDGYWKNPEKTKQILYDGLLHTEDIGYSDESGNIYILGRKSDVINSGGNKIAPAEIESVMMSNIHVAECACVPMEDKIAGQVARLFVVKKDETITVESLRTFLEDRLEGFKVPKRIDFIPELPKAANGKIIKSKLIEESTRGINHEGENS